MKVQINNKHFEILGVTRFSTKKEIKKAYRFQIKKWHPDKFPSNHEKQLEALEKSKSINEAFSLLENYTHQLSRIINSENLKQNEVPQKKYNDTNQRSN